jgi:hypothetical protein
MRTPGNFAVADLERTLEFYRDGLGLESRGIIGTEWTGDAMDWICDPAMPRAGRVSR